MSECSPMVQQGWRCGGGGDRGWKSAVSFCNNRGTECKGLPPKAGCFSNVLHLTMSSTLPSTATEVRGLTKIARARLGLGKVDALKENRLHSSTEREKKGENFFNRPRMVRLIVDLQARTCCGQYPFRDVGRSDNVAI